MNTPLTTSASLFLALAAALPASAASIPTPNTVEEIVVTAPRREAQPVPDDFIGPLAPGQCYASQCPGAMAPTEGALTAMGASDAMPSVQKMEDDMLKSGTYSSIDRDSKGNGAVITFPDGSIMYSDYKRGFDTIPKTPEQLLNDPSFMADNPAARAALLAAAQKAKDKKEVCSSLNPGQGCDDPSKNDKAAGLTSAGPGKKSPAPAQASASADTGAGGDQTDFNALSDIIMGRNGSDTAGGGQDGAGGPGAAPDPSFKRESSQQQADIAAEMAERAQSGTLGTINGGSLGFNKTREAAEKMNAVIKQGTRTMQADAPPSGQDTTNDRSANNSKLFGR
ncbi:MAG: hypothetical protein HY079_13250 [Elusimicrobia bacterium]|nr:hypothetical protein [Elusimicrobiota bacterium]